MAKKHDRFRASQIRNFTKRRLSGAYTTLCGLAVSSALSEKDRNLLFEAANVILPVLKNWDSGYIAKSPDEVINKIIRNR